MKDEREFQVKLKAASLQELLALYRTIDHLKYPERVQLVLKEIQAREHIKASPSRAETKQPEQGKTSEEQLMSHATSSDETPEIQDFTQDTRAHEVLTEQPFFHNERFYDDDQFLEIQRKQEAYDAQQDETEDPKVSAPDSRAHKTRGEKTSQHGTAYDETHKLRHMDTDYDARDRVSQKSMGVHHTRQHTSQRHKTPQFSLPRAQRKLYKGSYVALILGGMLYYLAITLVGSRFYEWNSNAVPVIAVSTLVSAGMCILVNLRIRQFSKAIGISIVMAFFLPAALGLIIAISGTPEYLSWLPVHDSSVIPSFISIAGSVSVVVGSIFHITRPH